MKGVLIFGGTTEGRSIAEYLGENGVKVHYCVFTEYGRSLMDENENIEVSSGRLGMDGMCGLMREYPLVIDATHPYAVNVTEHIIEACSRTGSEYVRVVRPEGYRTEGLRIFPDIDSAVEYLKEKEGNILVTTGSKDISKYAPMKDRVFARVLSNEDSLKKCIDAGLEGKNIICMQGPFTEELNYGMLKQFNAKYIVTKDSGQPGGFGEKIRAANRAGAEVILIGRPVEEKGMTIGEVSSMLSNRFGIDAAQIDQDQKAVTISIVGVGMGTPDGMTVEARNAICSADLIVGAKRMVESAGVSGKDILEEFQAERIFAHLSDHREYRSVAILVSGDVGFYSAAKKLLNSTDIKQYNVKVICGISSMVYLCGKLGISWDDVRPVSAHGRDVNIIGEVRRNHKIFSLLQGSKSVKDICARLSEYGMDEVIVTIGQDLGSEKERIFSGHPSEVMGMADSELCVALIVNPHNDSALPIGISDDDLIRGDAPMTKSEVRTLSISKLRLSEDSIAYDVGAGTGSVSIEMALVSFSGKVYAVEKEEEAVSLIEQNRRKFKADNIVTVKGYAPEALIDLPAPTHVFIGGSSGNLRQIIEVVIKKNLNVRIVVNSVTLETLSETMECIKDLDLIEEDTVCVNVSKGRKVGRYHLMTAQNPVYITTCRGKGS